MLGFSGTFVNQRKQLSRPSPGSQLVYLIALALPPERRNVDAERLSGVLERWRFGEHPDNVFAFDIVEAGRGGGWVVRLGGFAEHRVGQEVRADQVSLCENRSAFDSVTQLTHIA